MSDENEIVGHKTFATGKIGPSGFPELRHEPLTRKEADALWAACEAAKAKRAADMPTEEDALRVMTDAFHRLMELGWKQAMYCPKDGSAFKAIEAGSSGIHDCIYMGEWPSGGCWIQAEGDLWPSRPCLFKVPSNAMAEGRTPT